MGGPRTLSVIVLLALASGCWTVHRYDPATITEIETTIVNRRADTEYLSGVTATARQRRELEILTESELARLRAWRWRELQKR